MKNFCSDFVVNFVLFDCEKKRDSNRIGCAAAFYFFIWTERLWTGSTPVTLIATHGFCCCCCVFSAGLFSPFLRVIAAGGTITTEYRVVLARWFCSTHNESQRSMLAEKHRNVMLMCHRHYKYLQTTSREWEFDVYILSLPHLKQWIEILRMRKNGIVGDNAD